MGNESINWDKLGFDYIKTDKRFLQVWKNGEWQEGTLTDDNVLHISEGSTALHYGQQCFEGLKAYRCKDGSINLFRPDQNAARMQRSCARLLMPHVPTDVFIDACKQVVKANERFIPPYGSGGALYLRPFVIGTGVLTGAARGPRPLMPLPAPLHPGSDGRGWCLPHLPAARPFPGSGRRRWTAPRRQRRLPASR